MATKLTHDDLLVDGPERVAAGAALLDRKRPGWAAVLLAAAGTLEMDDCTECVLGKLFGDFGAGCNALDLPIGSGHGFELSVADVRHGQRRLDAGEAWSFELAYAALAELWVAAARQRTETQPEETT